MKKTMFLIYLAASMLGCTTGNERSLDYEITVSVYTHGTHKILFYRLTGEKILGIEYSTNREPEKVLGDRPLTEEEKARMISFLRIFPINDLKKEYANRDVEGEIHRVFDIRINNTRKEILVYFFNQRNIDELMDEILRLFPEKNN